MAEKKQKQTVVDEKPVIKADPAHNSFVYAKDAVMLEDKRTHPQRSKQLLSILTKPAFLVFTACVALSIFIGAKVEPNLSIQKVSLDMQTNESGQQFYTYKEKPVLVDSVTPIESQLTKENIALALLYQLKKLYRKQK